MRPGPSRATSAVAQLPSARSLAPRRRAPPPPARLPPGRAGRAAPGHGHAARPPGPPGAPRWCCSTAGPPPPTSTSSVLHGPGSSTSGCWPSTTVATARGSRTRAPFRLEDCADDVVAMADAIGLDRFVVLGYSMGGAVAQLLWRRHRDRLVGLVLVRDGAALQRPPQRAAVVPRPDRSRRRGPADPGAGAPLGHRSRSTSSARPSRGSRGPSNRRRPRLADGRRSRPRASVGSGPTPGWARSTCRRRSWSRCRTRWSRSPADRAVRVDPRRRGVPRRRWPRRRRRPTRPLRPRGDPGDERRCVDRAR